MKKLALLLLSLPLAACTIPTSLQRAQLKVTQLTQAETACADNAHYWRCVNNFTLRRYGMTLKRRDDGSVTLRNAADPFPGDPGAGEMSLAEYGSPAGGPE